MDELTYMSIFDLISLHSAERRLAIWRPDIPGGQARRVLLISAEMERFLYDNHANADQRSRIHKLRADLAVFTDGEYVHIAEDSKQSRDAYMARLFDNQNSVWEIRSRNPEPSIRVFGAFVAPDVFIALAWRERSWLKGYASLMWKDAIRKTKVEWRKLFLGYQPLIGDSISDYITSGGILVRNPKRFNYSNSRRKAFILSSENEK